MRLSTQLGSLVTTHQPIRPALAACVCSMPGAAIGFGLWLGAPRSVGLGMFAFVLTTVLLIALFSESLFVRQQVYEHGLLLSSVVPLTPRYAIPYATIDPDSIDAQNYHRTMGAADITDAFARRYRQAPFVGVVTFVGLSPAIARDVAKGRIDWTHAVDSARELPRRLRARGNEFEDWYIGVRDNTAAATDLRRRVADADRRRST